MTLIQNACVDMFVACLNQNLSETNILLPTRVWTLVLAMNGTMRTLNELISSLNFDSIVHANKYNDL